VDNNLGLNNKVYSQECKNFCDEYKYICDLKKNNICVKNVMNPECDNDNFIDFTDLNINKQPFESSINRRKGYTYAAEMEGLSEKYGKFVMGKNMKTIRSITDEYVNMYKFNYCLNKNRKANINCEKFIRKQLRSKPYYLEECKYNENMDNMICQQLKETRPDDYANYLKDFCLDKTNNKKTTHQVYNSNVCQNIRFKNKVKITFIIFGVIIGLIIIGLGILKYFKY
jgi:hypothetical protein